MILLLCWRGSLWVSFFVLELLCSLWAVLLQHAATLLLRCDALSCALSQQPNRVTPVVGNPWLDPFYQYDASEFTHGLGLISWARDTS
jgi:hypothetical protein